MREKFCTTCQTHRNEQRGKFVYRGNIKRWLCDECREKRSQSFISRERVKIRKEKINDLENL